MLPWQPNQEADHHNFSYFEKPLPKQHLNQIRVTLLQWFWRRSSKKIPFFLWNSMFLWQPNKMTAGHQMIITAKYDPQHFSGYGENAIQLFSH